MAYEQELGSADRYYDAIKSYRRMNAAKTKTKIWFEQVSDAQEIFDFLQKSILASLIQCVKRSSTMVASQRGRLCRSQNHSRPCS
jgi:hypothetical protein